jgi:hypothetical protein
MKYSVWIVLGAAAALAGAGARAQTELPSPTAEPGRLEAPQPGSQPGENAGDGAPEGAAPGKPDSGSAPVTSPTVAYLLSDRALRGGGPKFGLPLVRATLFPRGLAGWLDLSAGVSAGKHSRFENVALNGQLELAQGLRAHFTGVYRDRQGKVRADLSVQEGYVEGYGFTPVLTGRLGWNLKLGRTANLSWPYPDPLSLFDQLPFLNTGSDKYLVGYEHLTGVLDWDHPSGLGFHTTLNRRFRHAVGGRGDLDLHLVDYYARFRKGFGDGFNAELRFGGLNPRAGFSGGLTPRWAVVGGSIYLGKDWSHGSAGLMVERLESQSTRYGFRVSVASNAVTNVIGHFLGRYHRKSDAVTAQIPIAQLWTGQRERYKAPLFADRVGQIEATRMYRTGTWLQRDAYPLNYEYILRQTGVTKGSGLIRVVHEGPRALSEFGMMDGKGIPQAEVATRFRQDLTYDLYRVPQLGTATLNVRLLNKLKPSEPVANATVEAVDQVGRKQSFTATDGKFSYSASVPVGRPVKSTLKITAPGFLPETAEVQLATGEPATTDLLLRPANGLLTGVLLDAATGEPIAEVEVVVTGGGGEPKVILTDAKGQFQVEDLPPGRYAVATHAPRHRDQRVPAEIVAGEQKQVEIRLEARPASIAGKLLTADGKPVAGATVSLRDDAGNPVGSFTTLADGSFGTTGLKPGTYTLQAKTLDGKMVDSTIKLNGGEIATIELRLP